MQDCSAQVSILGLVLSLCVAVLFIIIQFISKDNILVDVGLLRGRVQVVIPIFAIVLLLQRKQARIVDTVCIFLDIKVSLVYIIVYLVHGELVGISKSQRTKFRKHGTKEDIRLSSI